MQAPVWGFRGERPILRTAVRARGPGQDAGQGRREHTVGQGQVMAEGGSGFCLKEEPLKAALEKMLLLANT